MSKESHGGYLVSEQYDNLLRMLDKIPESQGVLRLRCEIAHHPSFFPGGRGYVGPSFPQSSIMLVGHNFDTEEGFRRSVSRGHEDRGMKTWLNLLTYFLPEAKVSPQECFFTNLYLGAMIHPKAKPGEKQKTANTGTFKCSASYRAACIEGLRTQVKVIRPTVIALLGGHVPSEFTKAFPVYKSLSEQPEGGQKLQLLPDLTLRVIELAHPANPRSNESHRAQGKMLGAVVAARKLD